MSVLWMSLHHGALGCAVYSSLILSLAIQSMIPPSISDREFPQFYDKPLKYMNAADSA